MAWETTNPVTFNRLGRVDDWNKIWDNADYIANNVLQLTTPGTTDIIGGSGTAAKFEAFQGTAATENIIDVAADAGALSLRSGATTSGATASSFLKLSGSGLAGATEAVQLRLADIDNNSFVIEDHSGNELYKFDINRFLLTTGDLFTGSDSALMTFGAGSVGSYSSSIAMRAQDSTSGVGGIRMIASNYGVTSNDGIDMRFYRTGAIPLYRSAQFDDDNFRFFNPDDTTDLVQILPSADAEIRGIVSGSEVWRISGDEGMRINDDSGYSVYSSTNLRSWLYDSGGSGGVVGLYSGSSALNLSMIANDSTYSEARVVSNAVTLSVESKAGDLSLIAGDRGATHETWKLKSDGTYAPPWLTGTAPTTGTGDVYFYDTGTDIQIKVKTSAGLKTLATVAY